MSTKLGAIQETARRQWNDYRLIELEAYGEWRPVQPEDILTVHLESVRWLEQQLAKPFDGKTVVVTHHAPHAQSIHPSRVGDPLTPVFGSDLSALIKTYQPDLWVHGHIHHSVDYRIGRTRIICNPRGSVRPTFFGLDFENADFTPSLVIDI